MTTIISLDGGFGRIITAIPALLKYSKNHPDEEQLGQFLAPHGWREEVTHDHRIQHQPGEHDEQSATQQCPRPLESLKQAACPHQANPAAKSASSSSDTDVTSSKSVGACIERRFDLQFRRDRRQCCCTGSFLGIQAAMDRTPDYVQVWRLFKVPERLRHGGPGGRCGMSAGKRG